MLKQPTFVFITGASGSGKTTLVHGLHAHHPKTFNTLPSIATRAPRAHDEPNMLYCSKEDFIQAEKRGELMWKLENHGNYYGLRKRDFDDAVQSRHSFMMIVSPACIPILTDFHTKHSLSHVRFIFLHTYISDESTLRKRLTLRGDAQDAIEQRLADCREWNTYTRSLNLPVHFLENNNNPEDLINKASTIIDEKD